VKPTFFRDAAGFREWLSRHHDSERELLVGFRRKASGRPSITYPEALDEALCFGWIDGVRKRFDDSSYTIRFTPRRPNSNWSRVNIARVAVLTDAGRMEPSGLDAFARRDEAKSDGAYSYEARTRGFDEGAERRLRADSRAWAFFQDQPAGLQRLAIHWVMSAKREETRERRLASLIEHLRRETLPPGFMRPARKTGRAR
jgi:uncharacterized protein YdeI (YjbR/CyaY-like superfamily)